jgi:hypothetical protein
MRPRPPFECVALILQGGDALGAYQAGVCEASTETNLHPDWIAGTSIGAINGALIAGNPPEARTCIPEGTPKCSGTATYSNSSVDCYLLMASRILFKALVAIGFRHHSAIHLVSALLRR